MILATSGIDNNVKIWQPFNNEYCDLSNLDNIISNNKANMRYESIRFLMKVLGNTPSIIFVDPETMARLFVVFSSRR